MATASTSLYNVTYSAGHVVRWNPCQTIHYRVNTQRMPRGGLTDVKTAISKISWATGMKFKYDGTTSYLPQKTWTNLISILAPPTITVAWAHPGTGPGGSTLLPTGAAGYGGWDARSWVIDNVVHRLRIVAGFAILNTDTNRLKGGYGSGLTRGQLLLHELGHAMGLGHVNNSHQIMYPTLQYRSSTHYGKGDREGLAKLGRRAGCLS